MYKGKEERTEGKNCKGISLLNMIARIYGGVLVDSVCIMIERLINNDQGVRMCLVVVKRSSSEEHDPIET